MSKFNTFLKAIIFYEHPYGKVSNGTVLVQKFNYVPAFIFVTITRKKI